jgi:hypothetical protein
MKLQKECDLIGKPSCEQLKVIGSECLEGNTEVSELAGILTGRVRVPEGVTVAS